MPTSSSGPSAATHSPARRRPASDDTRTPATSDGASIPRSSGTSSLVVPGVSTSASAYATTAALRSRHSLYGTEDRIVLDLGSTVWKVGFSGEPSPRACLSVDAMLARLPGQEAATAGHDSHLWSLDKSEPDAVEWNVKEEFMRRCLRRVWHEVFMLDAKSRKVVIVENAMVPVRIKEMMARVLFDNLQVPSVVHVPAPLTSLIACGTVTGLVVDCGHLESTVVPVFAGRPMFTNMSTTPRAGKRLKRRLKALLLMFGSYARPPSSLLSTARPTVSRIPRDVLTTELLDQIITRMCFVGDQPRTSLETDHDDEPMQIDAAELDDLDENAGLLKQIEKQFAPLSAATSVSFAVPNLDRSPTSSGVGRGWIQIPGWIRERAAEILFEDGDEDERSLIETILDCVDKLPIDLRRPMASNVVVTGGTAMLPGLIPRLQDSVKLVLLGAHPPSPPDTPPEPAHHSLAHSSDSSTQTGSDSYRRTVRRLKAFRARSRYANLAPLANYVAILNNPSIWHHRDDSTARSGCAPAFTPALLPWIGASLAGALKIGGAEIGRETWDSIADELSRTASQQTVQGQDDRRTDLLPTLIPDWTRTLC
ncbi:hypothetical protein OIO90_001127 [Microbotryomycetes sp. JL221]|nr:hypothetical protein OIO90_001127 [Microbotryomycetes sp. JL221]